MHFVAVSLTNFPIILSTLHPDFFSRHWAAEDLSNASLAIQGDSILKIHVCKSGSPTVEHTKCCIPNSCAMLKGDSSDEVFIQDDDHGECLKQVPQAKVPQAKGL